MARNSWPGAVLYMDQVLAELATQAPEAMVRGTPSAVHRARVATRRMGAAIHVLHPLGEAQQWKPLVRALKRIRRSVQYLRDLDVMQEHLGKLAAAGAFPQACRQVQAVMAQERTRTQAAVAERAKVEKWLAKTGYWMAIRGGLAARDQDIQGLIRAALAGQFADFSARADCLSKSLLADDAEHDVEPHALRIAGKSLRYALEMAEAEKMGRLTAVLKRFKQLQDALGTWHDDQVLCARVLDACRQQLTGGRWHADQRELILLAAHVHRESEKHLVRFARLWKKHREFLASQTPIARLGVMEEQQVAPVVPTPETGPDSGRADKV